MSGRVPCPRLHTSGSAARIGRRPREAPPHNLVRFPACSPAPQLTHFTLQPSRTIPGGAPNSRLSTGGRCNSPPESLAHSSGVLTTEGAPHTAQHLPAAPAAGGLPLLLRLAVAACATVPPVAACSYGAPEHGGQAKHGRALPVHAQQPCREQWRSGSAGQPAATQHVRWLQACMEFDPAPPGAAPTVGFAVPPLAGGRVHARAAALREADVAHVLEWLLPRAVKEGEGGVAQLTGGRAQQTSWRQSSRHPGSHRPCAAPAGWPAASGWPR